MFANSCHFEEVNVRSNRQNAAMGPVIRAWCLLLAIAHSSSAAPHPSHSDYFEQYIRPVLVERCFECHSASADPPEAGLHFDQAGGWMGTAETGPLIIPGKPSRSRLLLALEYAEGVASMPPDSPLDDEVVARFRLWIKHGAVAPTGASPSADGAPDRKDRQSEAPTPRAHWAFNPPRAATHLTPSASARTRVDAIVDEHHSTQQLVRNPAASRAELIRRVTYDLTGLRPTYEQVQQFVRDSAPMAYERLVDRLLASPRFGERWARHWLDIARFADTKGYVFQEDRNYEDAHKFRDWVIASFNHDLPINRFYELQLAADKLAGDDPDRLAAMGFLTLGRRFLNNRHDIIDDRIDVTTRGLLGLTVSCARCHDHRYDPIPTEDYYAVYGIFASSHEPGGAPSPLRLEDRAQLYDPVVFLRGQPGRRGPRTTRRFLSVLPDASNPSAYERSSGRLAMARAITEPNNPLTARVFVNRVWGKLFGTYLVATPSDFGTRCEPPAMQSVLDDLAVTFVRQEWSLKRLVRTLVMSATYRQSARSSTHEGDADNNFFARMNRRRLDFEALRDGLLLATGNADFAMVGGPSVELTGQAPSYRRALYAHIDRQNFPNVFRTFDVAAPDTHTPKRFETTVPQQALFFLNSQFVSELAEGLGNDISTTWHSVDDQVVTTYRRVLLRDPSSVERRRALQFLNDARAMGDANPVIVFAHALLMSNEFMFID